MSYRSHCLQHISRDLPIGFTQMVYRIAEPHGCQCLGMNTFFPLDIQIFMTIECLVHCLGKCIYTLNEVIQYRFEVFIHIRYRTAIKYLADSLYRSGLIGLVVTSNQVIEEVTFDLIHSTRLVGQLFSSR